MKVLISFALFFACAGCASTQRELGRDYLAKLKGLSIGATESDVVRTFGKPSLREQTDDGGTKLTYSVLYERMNTQIPKVEIWLDSKNQIVAKYINLFSQSKDEMTIEHVEQRLGRFNFQSEPSGESTPHSISPIQILTDKNAGIVLRVDTARGNEVQSVSWYAPEVKRANASERR